MEKKLFEYQGILFDSQEEIWFAQWCEELKDAGYIKEWQKGIKSMKVTPEVAFEYIKKTQLKTKIKEEEKKFVLLHGLSYTPDFLIDWTGDGVKKFVSTLSDLNINAPFYGYFPTYVEIKPSFDQNNMTRDFITKQKFIFDKLKVFVNLIHPEDLFKKTFMPKEASADFKYKKSPTGKNKGKKGVGDWKMDWEPRTLKQFENVS